jgi:hypothetical protein
METKVSFNAWFPRLRLAEPAADVKYKGSSFLRGLSALRLAIA